MVLNLLFLALGMVLLIKGADWLVDGAAALAKKYKVSDLAIGLTIVAFGTSAPELVVNSFAAAEGHHQMVLGNVIGSNFFNLFLILGVAGIIIPLTVQSSTVWKEIPFSLFAIVLVFAFGNNFFVNQHSLISRTDGFILLGLFFIFLYYVYSQLKSDPSEIELEEKNMSNLMITVFIFAGLAGLVIGGKVVLVNAVSIAHVFGVSERIIGLTVVAAGTSLPELATSVVAAIKKKSDIAVGNIIGSNIFNFLLIFAISAIIRPIQYDTIFNRDLYLIAGGTAFLFIAMFTGGKKKLDRWEAAILLIVFLAYTYYLINSGN